MAWQLHYTSAKSGPTGRAGFQFVAETPGLPPEMRASVAPFMAYRPPPDAPLSPDADELARFPVALAYDQVGERALLVHSRYVGRDYSGRYGNFFAHAVVAEPGELEGLRPIELWQADLWHAEPADGELELLDDLPPGAALSPERLGEWLAETAAYPLLARLADAVVTALGRGHGRVVLISTDAEAIVRWIAVVSYSLPVPAASRLSFITYSADPSDAPHRLVGTTPDAWAAAHHDTPAFPLDTPPDPPPEEEPASRFAQTVAACWRERDLAGLDALGELALIQLDGPDGAGLPGLLDRAAALLALCRGEDGVGAAEEATAAELLTRHGAQVPEWVWPELVPALPTVGFELSLAIHTWARGAGAQDVADRCAARCVLLALDDHALLPRVPESALPDAALDRLATVVEDTLRQAADLTAVARVVALASRVGAQIPGATVREAARRCAARGAADLPDALAAVPLELRERLTEGAVAGLAETVEAGGVVALTDAACDLLEARDWSAAPAVGLLVLGSVGRRRRDRRVDVTGALLRLGERAEADIDAVLREVWAVPATVDECRVLIEAFAETVPRYRVLALLPTRAFLEAIRDRRAGVLEDLALLQLARQAREALPEGEQAERDASVLLAYAEAAVAVHAEPAARALRALDAAAHGATAELLDAAYADAAQRFARRDPRFRAELLAAAPDRVRARLAAQWVGDGRAYRGLRLRRSGAVLTTRNELVEVTLRLRLLGVREPRLESWVRGVAAGRGAARQLELHLREDRELRAALADVVAGRGD
jgi:GTPase-associated protein 1